MRNYKRFSIELPAQYMMSQRGESDRKVTVLNVGSQGLCFESKNEIFVGENLELNVDLSADDQVQFKVEVIWITKMNDKYRIGVKIAEASHADEARFIRFYCHQILGLVDNEES